MWRGNKPFASGEGLGEAQAVCGGQVYIVCGGGSPLPKPPL